MVCKLAAWLFLFKALAISAQDHRPMTLFQNETPLLITLKFPYKEIKKNTNDSTYFPSVLYYYENERRVTDSLRMSLRARGNFRRKHCFYTPLRLKIKKKDAAGSVFEGNKALKLVLPCQTAERFNELITLEYICYKFYECATPYVFSTRLLDIDITDEKHPEKTSRIRGFFIEDDDRLAKRFNGKVIEEVTLHPLNFHDTSTVNHDFFQYMIGNTDWSVRGHHNAKMIETTPRKYIPVAYDFDMSGFVNPPYATINPELEIDHLQQRVYRGYCQDAGVMQFVRSKYLDLEPRIWEVFNRHHAEIPERTFENRRRFLEEFFRVLKDDRSFTEKILKKCRKI